MVAERLSKAANTLQRHAHSKKKKKH